MTLPLPALVADHLYLRTSLSLLDQILDGRACPAVGSPEHELLASTASYFAGELIDHMRREEEVLARHAGRLRRGELERVCAEHEALAVVARTYAARVHALRFHADEAHWKVLRRVASALKDRLLDHMDFEEAILARLEAISEAA